MTAPLNEKSCQVDEQLARRFLKSLDPNGGGFVFQTFQDRQDLDKDETLIKVIPGPAQAELLRLYERGAGIYVTVNRTDGTGRKIENITGVRAIWQEDDGDGFQGEFPIPPSMVVESSPGHHHRYWMISGEWPADEKGRSDFDGVIDHMVEKYGSCEGAKGINRVLRVPGFLHRKTTTPHLVRIVSQSGRRYTRKEILAAFPPIIRKQAPPAIGRRVMMTKSVLLMH
jgi:hypothetical protein